MGRILVLAGSPRKDGNTDRLVSAFVRGASRNHEVEVISVHEVRVNPCAGCNTCLAREGNRCVQQDDMDRIYDRLLWADTLIVASPVYFYGISAQLKAVIDRLHTSLRKRFPVRRLGLILVGAAELPDLFDPIIAQYRMILRFFGLQDAGMVLVRGAREKGDAGEESLRQAFQMGAALDSPTCECESQRFD